MADRDRTALAGLAPRSSGAAVRALLLAAVPPALWFAHLNVSYLLVPPSCRWGHGWGLAAVTVVALAGIATTAAASWRRWRADGGASPKDLVAFIGASGAALGVLFAVATLLVAASALVVDPCH